MPTPQSELEGELELTKEKLAQALSVIESLSDEYKKLHEKYVIEKLKKQREDDSIQG